MGLCLAVGIGCILATSTDQNSDTRYDLFFSASYNRVDCSSVTAGQSKAACNLVEPAENLSVAIKELTAFLDEYLGALKQYAETNQSIVVRGNDRLYALISDIGVRSSVLSTALENSSYAQKDSISSESEQINDAVQSLKAIIQPLANDAGVSDRAIIRELQCAMMRSGNKAATVKAIANKYPPSDSTISTFCNSFVSQANLQSDPDEFDIKTWNALNTLLREGSDQLTQAENTIQSTLVKSATRDQSLFHINALIMLLSLLLVFVLIPVWLSTKSNQSLYRLLNQFFRKNNNSRQREVENVDSNRTHPPLTEPVVRGIIAAYLNEYLESYVFERLIEKKLGHLSKIDDVSFVRREIKAEVFQIFTRDKLGLPIEKPQPISSNQQLYFAPNLPPAPIYKEPSSDNTYDYPTKERKAEPLITMPSTSHTVISRFNSGHLKRADAHDIVTFDSDSQEAFRLGQTTQPVLNSDRERGTYWVIAVGSELYLVPKTNARFNVNTLQALSSLYDYPTESNLEHPIRLVQPAMVVVAGSERWQLMRKGQLSFG